MQTSNERWLAKAKFKNRLKAEGRWVKFNSDRAAFHKKHGIPHWIAGIALCLKEYAPLDGSPPEYGADDFADIMKKATGRSLDGYSPAPTPEQAVQLRLAAAAGVNQGAAKSKRVLEWERLRRKVYRVQKLGRLRAGKDETSVVRWCWENAETPPEDLDPFDVPGTGAIKLLRTIQDDPRAYDDFVKNCFTKMLAKGLDNDFSGGPGDDGRTQLRVMDRLDEIEEGDDEDTVARKLTPTATDENAVDDEDIFDDIDFEEEISALNAGPEGTEGQPSVPPEGLDGGAGI